MFFGFPPSINQRMFFKNQHADVSSYKILEKKIDKLTKRIDNLYFDGNLSNEKCRKDGPREGIKQTH